MAALATYFTDSPSGPAAALQYWPSTCSQFVQIASETDIDDISGSSDLCRQVLLESLILVDVYHGFCTGVMWDPSKRNHSFKEVAVVQSHEKQQMSIFLGDMSS